MATTSYVAKATINYERLTAALLSHVSCLLTLCTPVEPKVYTASKLQAPSSKLQDPRSKIQDPESIRGLQRYLPMRAACSSSTKNGTK